MSDYISSKNKTSVRVIVRCNVCGRFFTTCAIRRCKNYAVNRYYGDKSGAFVCYYCCKKCKFKQTVPYTSALGCACEDG